MDRHRPPQGFELLDGGGGVNQLQVGFQPGAGGLSDFPAAPGEPRPSPAQLHAAADLFAAHITAPSTRTCAITLARSQAGMGGILRMRGYATTHGTSEPGHSGATPSTPIELDEARWPRRLQPKQTSAKREEKGNLKAARRAADEPAPAKLNSMR